MLMPHTLRLTTLFQTKMYYEPPRQRVFTPIG